MKNLRRILIAVVIIVMAALVFGFSQHWVRAEKAIDSFELSPISALSASEVLIADSAFGRPGSSDRIWCPSFSKFLSRESSMSGPSTHLARLITEDESVARETDYHLQNLFVACRLEREFSASEIAKHTLSRVYLGKGEFGVEQASQSMFQKAVPDLSQGEVFKLAALIQHPTLRNDDAALKARALELAARYDAPK